MDNLIGSIESLKKSPIKNIIDKRLQEFASFKDKSDNEIFKELCFCLLTANFNAAGGIRIQKEINDGFLHLPQEELAKKLSDLGHRFPNARAKFIAEAQKYRNNIKEILNEENAREWLVNNVKGLGMKEASHFLRNIGFRDYAIVDFHIVDALVKNGLIERPKTLTERKYLEIESTLKGLADKLDMSLGELDLYLWFLETGKVLK